MKCPHCQAWSLVRETRGVKRRRECANGHRFTTQEVALGRVDIKPRAPGRPREAESRR